MEDVQVLAKRKSLECDICGKRFKQRRYLMAHKNVHAGVKMYKCNECPAKYYWPDNLRVHKAHHTEKPSKCDQCDATFAVRSNLKRHQAVHNEMKSHKCSKCDRSFVQKATLTAHMRRHTGERPFSCALCPSSFSQSATLKRHIKMHAERQIHVCDICSATFSTAGNMKRHRYIHTGERPYPCDQCDAAFTNKGCLNRHLISHSGRPRCAICDKTFAHFGSLNDHSWIVHRNTDGWPCKKCSIKCSTQRELLQHRKSFHGTKARGNESQARKATRGRVNDGLTGRNAAILTHIPLDSMKEAATNCDSQVRKAVVRLVDIRKVNPNIAKISTDTE